MNCLTRNFLTIVAPHPGGLTSNIVDEVGQTLNNLGAKSDAPSWLSAERAIDMPFDGVSPSIAENAVRGVLKGHALDMLAGHTFGRRKKLLVADMDATIITTETLDELAATVGLKGNVAAITSQAMNGELNFEDAIKKRVALLSNMPTSMLAVTYAKIKMTSGATQLVNTMRAAGAYCVLVSGGFTYFASRIADTCGFHENYSNQLEINNGRLTGRIIEPILGKEAKLSILKRLIKDHALEPVDTVVVGDGANDLPMIKAAGLGVSFHGKASVAVAAPTRIEHGDLTTLLFYQGFYEQEFSTGTNTKL